MIQYSWHFNIFEQESSLGLSLTTVLDVIVMFKPLEDYYRLQEVEVAAYLDCCKLGQFLVGIGVEKMLSNPLLIELGKVMGGY